MKESVRHFIIAVLILILPVFILPAKVFCQKILDPEFRPPDVRWDNFLIKGGEASQKSISMLIDSKGFLWSGTETGLYRYDGARYLEFGVRRGKSSGFAGLIVTNIFEDSDGVIWVGTSEALNKLDLNDGSFLHYFPDTTRKGGISNFIRSIREDRNGLLWIRTSQHIYSFDKETGKFTRFETDSLSWYPKNDLYTVESQCYTEDSLGNKWFVTNNGLFRFENLSKIFRKILPLADGGEMSNTRAVKCVYTDKNGTVWIGTQGEGLLRWDQTDDAPRKIDIQPEGRNRNLYSSVTTILTDRDGSVWSFGNGVFSNFSPADGSVRNYLVLYKYRTVYEAPGSPVWIDDAFQYNDGTLWFLNKKAGLMFRFNPVTEKLCLYRTPTFIAYQCIMDSTENFWFSCIRNNISRLVTRNVPYFTYPIDNSANTAQTNRGNILEDNMNNVWFLSNKGTYIFRDFDNTKAIEPEQFRFPDGNTVKESGFTDSKGNLWFGTINGRLTRYNPETKNSRNFTLPSSLDENDLFRTLLIREDSSGNIWIATASSGLYRITGGRDRPEHVLDFNKESGDQNQKMLMDFLIDSKEEFWILTAENLLSIRPGERKIVDYTGYGDGLFSVFRSNIRIREDRKGNIWILNSRSGLFLFNRDDASFSKVNVIDEGPDSDYYDLLIDRTNRLWIGHNKGIAVFDPVSVHKLLIPTPRLQYDLQSRQISSGQVLFLNDNQLYIFNENIPLNTYIPPVFLTGLRIVGKDYRNAGMGIGDIRSLRNLDLPYYQNTITIEFAALNYLNPEWNKYRYIMAKRDKDTLTVSQGTSAEYKSIPPGRYRFWVTGSNNDGLWNPEGISLDIRIHPPWYRSGLAFVLYLVLFFAALAILVRIRLDRLTRDKIKLKAEIESATSELEVKNRQLSEMDRVKTNFFTDISHEIRTPLSLILGPLEDLSRNEGLSSGMAEIVELMKRNAHRLMYLVNQLLDISRLDAGRMKITLAEDDVVKCLRIFVYEFLSLAESKHIRYVVDLPEQGFFTWFDRDKIEKIISNLLTNAFKNTPANGSVQCIIKIITPLNGVKYPSLEIRILDTGTGISRENQAKIFERFYRIEGPQEAPGYGTGIGLSLVSEFVSLLHGEIQLKSVPGIGSEFTVTLHLGKDHLSPEEFILVQRHDSYEAKPEIIAWHEKYPEGQPGRKDNGKMKILVIEDNDDLREYIRESLAGDYSVVTAEKGSTGINTAFTVMPDLIITDIMMPDLYGVALCGRLKNDERTSHIPVIMLTAKATIDDKIEGLRSGADDYMVKPFNMAELKTRIANLLILRKNLQLKYSTLRLSGLSSEKFKSVDDRFMEKVILIINRNLKDFDFDVEHLREELGMSRVHLSRKLKILTGLPPGILIRNIRLEKAAELISHKTGNITEVANTVGMSNPSNFTKTFRAYFGISPREYSSKFIVSGN